MNMRKQYTLEPARIMDIQGDPSKYLPIAMYAIGCHMGEMTEQELEGLMYALSAELQERDRAKEFEENIQQWENTQNVAYCEGHDFT
jgi:hypothetical protein